MLVYLFNMNKSLWWPLINVNSVLTKGTYQVKWSAFGITCLDGWHKDVCLWHLTPSLSSPYFFLFLQLLSAYFASVVFLDMFIFSLFPVCCDYFIAWSSLVFYLMEYSGKHDISLLTLQANAEVYRKSSVVWIKL